MHNRRSFLGSEKIEDVVSRNGLTVKYIVNTHHHFDHTIGNKAMADSTGAKIIQHEESDLEHDITVKDGERLNLVIVHYR